MALHEVSAENAGRFVTWFRTRGGIAIWKSVNLSNLDKSWTTPIRNEDGTNKQKPSWEADDAPSRYVMSMDDVDVILPGEVKRFHVAVRKSTNGMSLKLTDASTKKVRAAVEKAGPDAWYEFDLFSQDAVILRPMDRMTLAAWAEKNC